MDATVSQAGSVTERHGGKILIDQLAIQGVQRVFCIPGESYLAALDGLYHHSIETIVCRQEGGAAMMAEADGKLTGRPGIAFVTRGPGATNASSGIHIAFQDSSPMILFVGQVASDQRDREAFQEVDYRQMFGPLAKWVAEIERIERIPEYVSHAFHVATSGRPGPVVLALPEDMLSATATVADVPHATAVHQAASPAEVDQITSLLATAERPLVIVGGPCWSVAASNDLAEFASRFDIPVGTSFRCQDYLDNDHPNYAGDVGIGLNPKLAERVRDADVLLVIGARLGEMTTSGYSLLSSPTPKQRLIHTHPDPNELGRVYRPDLAIACNSAPLLARLAHAPAPRQWSDESRAARVAYDEWQTPTDTPGAVKFERIITHLNEVLPDSAIVTNGAGNYAAWAHRYRRYRGGAAWRTQLAPTSGSMGYGLPAAIAAKLRYPEREVVCLAGDGCFQMTSQEFGTACQWGANVIVLIANNRRYGTILMHQEKHYPGRPSATELVNPDFAALSRAYGAFGATVTETDQFPDALAAARAAGTPAIIDLITDPQAVSHRTKA